MSSSKKHGGLSFFKIMSSISALTVAGTALYCKYVYYVNSAPAVDLSKCALGQYPLAKSIDKEQFKTIFGSRSQGRAYNTFFLFNALAPEAGCPVCPSVDVLFKEITAGIPQDLYFEKKMAFASIDLSNGREIFGMMNVQTAPFLVFLKAESPEAQPFMPVTYNLRNPMDRRGILNFINDNLGTKIDVKAKRTPSQISMMVVKFLLLVGLLVAGAQGKLGRFIYNPWIAMTLTIGFIIVMNSGYMFSKIRGHSLNPFDYNYANMFQMGIQQQSGAESWITGIITVINALATVILGAAVPKIQNPIGRRLAALVFTALIVFGFSLHVQIFKKKMPSYPFPLMFK